MPGGRLALAALLLASIVLSGCELVGDGPAAPRAAPRPTPTGAAAPPAASVATAARTQPPIISTPTLPPAASKPSPGAGSPTPKPAATAAPAPKPTSAPPLRLAASGYRRYTSTLYTYAIDHLETWRPVSGGASFEGGQADLFTGERRGDAVSAVTVFTQTAAPGTTGELLLESSLAELSESGVTPGPEQARTIDGNDAYIYSYTLDRNGQSYAITQAIFLREGRAWVLTLTATPDEADRLLPVFNHMLDSVQVWG